MQPDDIIIIIYDFIEFYHFLFIYCSSAILYVNIGQFQFKRSSSRSSLLMADRIYLITFANCIRLIRFQLHPGIALRCLQTEMSITQLFYWVVWGHVRGYKFWTKTKEKRWNWKLTRRSCSTSCCVLFNVKWCHSEYQIVEEWKIRKGNFSSWPKKKWQLLNKRNCHC